MKLTNKYIAEGMYVTNGKQIWKVIDWDSKYRYALLQKIDKNGNKTDYFVVAENYELYGDENEALISWMNGNYLDDVSQSDAEEYFDDFYKKDKKINESVHWKDKSRAEEVVNMLNSELKESKKSIKERSEENEIIISELQDTVEYFCGLYEEVGELKGNALKDLQNAIERLEVFNAIGSIYQWGVEVLNKCGIKYKGLKELKKSFRKSLKESAKPINEKNVAKFVDELNKWCDDNIHYVDMDAENFTKKYGKIYNFKYRKEDDFFVIYDSEGTLDLFDREASLVYPTLDKLAKKNGWYIDPYSCACDFTFGEL